MITVPARPSENTDLQLSRDSQRESVLSCLKEYGFLCDRAISQVIGLDVNLVNARRHELVDAGLVYMAFKAKSPFSSVRVKHWSVK